MCPRIFNGICNPMNILIYAGKFGAVSTYYNAVDVYYIVNYVLSPYIFQYETIIDRHTISSVERVINTTYLI